MHRVFLEPTPHAAVAEAHAAEDGLAILTGVLGRDDLTRLRAATIPPDPADPLKHQAVRDLLEHPVALRFAHLLLGPKVRLSHLSATVTGMHADQGHVTPPWPDFPLGVTLIWAIEPFTAETAAIRVMPDSKNYGHGPEWGLDYPDSVPLLCPEGSVIVMDTRVWHQAEATTRALSVCYIRPWLLPRVDWAEHVRPGDLTLRPPRIVGFRLSDPPRPPDPAWPTDLAQ